MVARSGLRWLLYAALVFEVFSSQFITKGLRKSRMPIDLNEAGFDINETSDTCFLPTHSNSIDLVLNCRGGAFRDRMPTISLSLGQVKLLLQVNRLQFMTSCIHWLTV